MTKGGFGNNYFVTVTIKGGFGNDLEINFQHNYKIAGFFFQKKT